MSSVHSQYHYRITCHTDDEAVLSCLRALTDFAEHSSRKKIAWGNTKKRDWERSDHCIKFRFSRPEFRDDSRQEATELLGGRWCERGASDSDPAIPARRKHRSNEAT